MSSTSYPTYMPTHSVESLQQNLSHALSRISDLETKIEKMRQNTNSAFNGQASILIRLVGHTHCPPPQGTEFVFVRSYDVGTQISGE